MSRLIMAAADHKFSFSSSLQSSQLPRFLNGRRSERVSTSVLAMRKDGKREKRGEYKLVDENMVVLKMRIEEMKASEREDAAAAVERERERGWYENYESDVYELVGLLQMMMMNNRPSLVLGVVALLVLSSSTSLALLLSYLLANFM